LLSCSIYPRMVLFTKVLMTMAMLCPAIAADCVADSSCVNDEVSLLQKMTAVSAGSDRSAPKKDSESPSDDEEMLEPALDGRVQALPGNHFINDDGTEVYGENDEGTITNLADSGGDADYMEVIWDRTGATSDLLKDAQGRAFQIISDKKPQEPAVMQLPSSLAATMDRYEVQDLDAGEDAAYKPKEEKKDKKDKDEKKDNHDHDHHDKHHHHDHDHHNHHSYDDLMDRYSGTMGPRPGPHSYLDFDPVLFAEKEAIEWRQQSEKRVMEHRAAAERALAAKKHDLEEQDYVDAQVEQARWIQRRAAREAVLADANSKENEIYEEGQHDVADASIGKDAGKDHFS